MPPDKQKHDQVNDDWRGLLVDPTLIAKFSAYQWWIRIASGVAAVLFIAGCVVLAWGAYRFTDTPEALDQFGGFLSGTTGALWSAAGLFLIFAAFVGQLRQSANQEEDIRLNRVELRQTQTELRGQKEQLAEQNRTFRQRRFESTFFQLLGLHHHIVNSMDRTEHSHSWGSALLQGQVQQPATEYRGRDVFVRIYRELQRDFEYAVKSNGRPGLDVLSSEIYEGVYQRNQSDLGHYFRNLYTIVKFVSESDVENKRQYTNIVRAQLSTHELLLLFYNALSEYGVQKFKPLIEEYGLLKNMPEDMLLDEGHRNAYRSEAFGVVGLTAESLPS